jgi:anti-sigma-K factor RskA
MNPSPASPTRHWSRSPQALDRLAAEYVLGTLQGRARRRFEALLPHRAQALERVRHWEAQLAGLSERLPAQAPSEALWARLAAQTGTPAPATIAASLPTTAAASVPAPAPAPAPAPPRPRPAAPPAPSLWQRFWTAWLQPVPAGALAFGLVAGVALTNVLTVAPPPQDGDPMIPSTVPASYIGVLATPEGRQGLIVASLRQAREVELKQVTPLVVPDGQQLMLWALSADGAPRAIGPIPSAPFVRAPLPDTAERVFGDAVELAVSLEPVGTSPALPSGAFVVRGLCGKVWPPAGAASAAR